MVLDLENSADFYPTPPESPLAALLALALRSSEDDEDPKGSGSYHDEDPKGSRSYNSWKACFLAGSQYKPLARIATGKAITKTVLGRILRKGIEGKYQQVFRQDLLPAPKKHKDLEDHPFGSLFE